MRYKAKPIPVQAIQLDIALTYEKWGGTQCSRVGDWLLSKEGETYTCESAVFAETYRQMEHRAGWFYKDVTVDAVQAEEDGVVKTLEGSSDYLAGDYIVTNPGGDRYCVDAAKFESLYVRL